MGKRPRTPHFISGIGDGNVNLRGPNKFNDDNNKNSGTVSKRERYIHKRDERLVRLEEPLAAADQWRDVFGNREQGLGSAISLTSGFLSVSPFWVLGMIVVISALGLLLLSDSSSETTSRYRRRQKQRRMYRTRKKKTDEWSDDEEVLQDAMGYANPNLSSGDGKSEQPQFYPYYYQQPAAMGSMYSSQEHRLRRTSITHEPNSPGKVAGVRSGGGNYYLPNQGVVPAYKSPAASMIQTNHSGVHRRGVSPKQSYVGASQARSPGLRTRRLSDTPDSISDDTLSSPGGYLPPAMGSPAGRIIGSPSPSRRRRVFPPLEMNESFQGSQQGLNLSSNTFQETPLIGNMNRKTVVMKKGDGTSALLPPLDLASPKEGGRDIPFIPSLNVSSHHKDEKAFPQIPAPPRSITVEDLRLLQMETGSSSQWGVDKSSRAKGGDVSESQASFYEDDFSSQGSESSASGDSDISIPSGDPRKTIIHKRKDLTMATDAATSLLSSIDFKELKLVEVIGGGGFGQVWKASWQGTPVAVKVLTGSAQNKHVAKAILEEFKAEINLLKGMRHPNICLYMGACFDPPNRAIVTELAANGSVWDALRLPLMPPYEPADGTARGSWPLKLYLPDEHGAPPVEYGSHRMSAPILPKGTWPWPLVKRVACGAARGMAYLHSGNPPVLHRDLKSANLLLDESYTAKVCDFGLSRLKEQERSMTGNCGTVQWMAPEVLANMSYNEKADVYSFGIILWELLSRECPFDGMSPIQCALAVLNRDKRPDIPKWCPPSLHALIKSCIKKEANHRPSFVQIILALDAMD